MPSRPTRSQLTLFLAGFFLVWTGWAFLLVGHYALSDGLIRAGVRLALWVVPALLFVRYTEGLQEWERIGLQPLTRRGVAYGLVGALGLFGLLTVQHRAAVLHLTLPTDAATWLNSVLTAPLAEEILFRGVVFRVMGEQLGFRWALPASAALFALSHLPYWIISGEKTGWLLANGLGSVFLLGMFFALLFHRSRSLWAAVICHAFNNLMNVALHS